MNALKDTFFYLHKCTVQASSRKFSWGMNLEVRNGIRTRVELIEMKQEDKRNKGNFQCKR